ncbi:MAG TPA: GTPase [Acidimicrobiales bacterium]|nr:GTPase [Acidimicrobiales bacterium]
MSPSTAPRQAAKLTERLGVLREIVERAPGRLPEDLTVRAALTVEKADTRLAHGFAHTVVAIAGATGSGKSSLFNALVGETLAEVGIRRPTTATTQAAVFGGGADRLLDWLRIARRNVVPGGDLDGLVLLDLPDHDSVQSDHRDEVDRLVGVVDAFVWVMDPQKYADAALHRTYLSRFAAHGVVSIVVLNQIDTVTAQSDQRAMLEHISRLLALDGLEGVRTFATSMRSGDGVAPLRRELAARVAERRALVARLDADIDWLVDELRIAVGDVIPDAIDRDSRQRLGDAFAYAAGVDAVADAVGAAHRYRSSQHAGWPPVRWIARLRPDPLRRLGLDRIAARVATSDGQDVVVGRTSRDRPNVVALAAVDEALRDVGAHAAEHLPELWVDRINHVAIARRDDVADALDVAIASAKIPTGSPRWWAVASAAQGLVTTAMVIGLVWLFVIGVVAWLNLPDLPAPDVGVFPVPTLLAVFGAAGGLIVAAIARRTAAIGGRRRRTRARRVLRDRTSDVASTLVIEPLDAELAELGRLQSLVRRLDR